MATTTRKAKRKLSDISFEKEGAHVALVSSEQGGPANGHDYALVMKANNFSQEAVQKMQQIRVTMELPDFLRKFFSMYYEDAEVLARMMGYVEPEEEDSDEEEDYYDKYINERLASFEILKAAYNANSLPEYLSQLKEGEFLAMLEDQVQVEKAMKQAEDKKESTQVAKAAKEEDTSIASEVSNEGVSTSDSKQELEKSMVKKVENDEQTTAGGTQVEMVEKAVVVSLEKKLEEQSVQLQKALELVAAFEAEKKEAVVKAKTAKIEAIVKDAKQSAALVKAAIALEDEADFNAFVASLEAVTKDVEKSALFQEQGASVSTEENKQTESPVAKAVKAQLGKSK